MCEDRPRRALHDDSDPDFADEHSRPTYEDEDADSPAAPGDESVPEGPASERRDQPKRPL